MNWELPDIQAGFRKGRGTRDQLANIRWIFEKAREFLKNIYFCFIDCTKPFDSVYHNKLWKILKEIGIPDHLNCLLRNLYAGQETTVKTGHATDWFQIRKGVHQGYLLSPCLFNLHEEYIMWNAGLDEAQAGIMIARRNINNLRYTDDTTLMTESKEEQRSLLMKVKGEWKSWHKTQHSKNKDHGIQSHLFMANRYGNTQKLYFLGFQNHRRWWLQPWNLYKRRLLLGKKNYDQPRQHIEKQRHYFADKGPYSQSF